MTQEIETTRYSGVTFVQCDGVTFGLYDYAPLPGWDVINGDVHLIGEKSPLVLPEYSTQGYCHECGVGTTFEDGFCKPGVGHVGGVHGGYSLCPRCTAVRHARFVSLPHFGYLPAGTDPDPEVETLRAMAADYTRYLDDMLPELIQLGRTAAKMESGHLPNHADAQLDLAERTQKLGDVMAETIRQRNQCWVRLGELGTVGGDDSPPCTCRTYATSSASGDGYGGNYTDYTNCPLHGDTGELDDHWGTGRDWDAEVDAYIYRDQYDYAARDNYEIAAMA